MRNLSFEDKSDSPDSSGNPLRFSTHLVWEIPKDWGGKREIALEDGIKSKVVMSKVLFVFS